MKKETKISLIFLIILFLIATGFIAGTIATNSGSSNNANLTIWDDIDLGLVKVSNSSVYFYANFTNSTSGNSISDGNCSIRFNFTGTWSSWNNMTYNTTYTRFQFNRTFNYKGQHSFEVNCSNASSAINITDSFNITNSNPQISWRSGGTWIDFDGNPETADTWQCTEDAACYYNFTANITELDVNDVLSFSYGTENTTLTNYTLNETTGLLLINITNSNNTGNDKKIELKVKDNDLNALWQSALLAVDVVDVNDPPIFVGLQNWTFNMSELFERIINVTDEENNIPFVLNITFLNCSTALWSTRNNTNCILFNSSQYSFNGTSGILNISFTTSRNDVGSYIINFSVMDNSSLGNKTTSQVVNFTVLNVNVAPYFAYVCGNERNTTENSQFTCWINATDIDETNNLTFSANYSWFTFNSASNSISVNWNVSSDYNFSAIVNFTPTDIAVGNWSVNITLTDTGSPVRRNSTVFWFFINNTEDIVSLDVINNYTLYENRTIYVNATDNDLLVTQKNIKNEVLTFASNTSWVNISTFSSASNYTTARIIIDYDAARSIGTGNYTIKVNVTDTTGNFAERSFTITIEADTAAVWNITSVFVIYEHNLTYFNFSQNVTDAEGDSIAFSFVSDTSFPSFSINATTGIINFTSTDEDVGYHNITINASDGKLNSLKTFNFTVYNINDLLYIETPLFATNASVNSTNSNMNTTEDNLVQIDLYIRDNDFRIPSGQKNFYNESLTINLTIQGPNNTLFGFIKQSNYPTESGPNANRSYYLATFTPRKSDVGYYNITINVSDASNASSILQFNLTIVSINHAPVLMNLTNHTSAINRSLYYRINATDIEDGNSTTLGNTNFTFTYNFTSGRNIFNGTIFNSTTGEINITFNSSHGGTYRINITVNDSFGLEDSADFWLYVYDYPNVIFPALGYNFSLAENVTSNLTFIVNHSIQDNLTYEFYIEDSNNSILGYNVSYYSNATNLTWQFTPNFTDETYGNFRNLTLIVYPSNAQLENRTNLNTTIRWNININHTNAPVVFSGHISDYQTDYNNVITINLGNYFSDFDYSDNRYNQTVNFSILSNSTPSYIIKSISNWTLTLSSLIAVTELLTINASDLNSTNDVLTSAISNVFEVKFTVPTTTPTPTPSSGGGGATKPLLLKIILPDPVSAYKKDKIVLPIILSNEGKVILYGINLTASIAKNNTLKRDITLSFDKNYISSLQVGEKKNITLIANINTEEIGLYEITINASVKDPKYSDWGKLYLTIKETNKTEVLEKLLFTEEFIAENPECIEIKEIVKDAWRYYEAGDYKTALEKAGEAIDACRYAIAQPALPRKKESTKNDLYKYLSVSALVVIVIGIVYYFYKRAKLKEAQIS